MQDSARQGYIDCFGFFFLPSLGRLLSDFVCHAVMSPWRVFYDLVMLFFDTPGAFFSTGQGKGMDLMSSCDFWLDFGNTLFLGIDGNHDGHWEKSGISHISGLRN